MQDPKQMAKALRTALAEHGTDITHSQALEIVARQHGAKDWNTLSARLTAPQFTETCPILRIFDEAKALEFYTTGFLGFTLDWEHRFAPGMPLYAQVSRAGLVLHLSGHHGDATPGATTFVRMKGITEFHAEITARKYPNMRPGIENSPWGREVTVIDPFQNRIRFCEHDE